MREEAKTEINKVVEALKINYPAARDGRSLRLYMELKPDEKEYMKERLNTNDLTSVTTLLEQNDESLKKLAEEDRARDRFKGK